MELDNITILYDINIMTISIEAQTELIIDIIAKSLIIILQIMLLI
jgi:hypothetical protein